METKANYVLVGSFVALLGTAMLAGVLWLSKADFRDTYDRYHAFMRESVTGLSVNSTVKYRGVDVGRVKDIALSPDNPEEVRLTLDIVRGTPVKIDTIAVLETQGLTGLAMVNLTGGSRDSPPLRALDGQEYPVIKTGPSLFFRLDEAISRLLSEKGLTTLLADLDTAAKSASEVLNEGNRMRLSQTLEDLSAVAQLIAARKDQLDRGLAGAAQSGETLAKMTKSLDEQVPALLMRINRSATTLQAMTEELARTSRAVGAVVNESKPGLEQFSRETLPETGLLVAEMRRLTGTLNRIAGEIEREPDQLLFGRKTPARGPGE